MKRRQKHSPAPARPQSAPAAPLSVPPSGWPREWLLAAGLLTLTFFAYLPVLKCGFFDLDDGVYVTANPALRHGLSGAGLRWALTGVVTVNWLPVTQLSLLVDYQIFGLKPWGYHLVNVLLHLANTLLLFRCLRVLTGRVGTSAAVAALFALHPLHVEAVAWVAERKELLSAFFGLLALRAYAWYAAGPSARRMAVVATFLALSLLAKPMWVTFPFLLLLLDWWPLRRTDDWRRLLIEKLSLFGLVAAFCVTTMLTQIVWKAPTPDAPPLPLWIRAGNAFLSCCHYLRQTLVPTDLAVLYPHPAFSLSPWEATAAALVVGAFSVLACRVVRGAPYLFVGWFWFLGMLVPVIGIVQVGNQARADRYTYVPLIGVFLILAWGTADLLRRVARPRLAPVLAAPVLLACAVFTWLQATRWQDNLSLWEHTASVTSKNFAAHKFCGSILLERDRPAAALEHFDAALRFNPADPEGLEGRGRALLALRRIDGALEMFQAALRLDANLPISYYHLGQIRQARREDNEAAECFRASVALAPLSPDPWFQLGKIRFGQGDCAEAADCFAEAGRLFPATAPEKAAAYVGRAEALIRLGRTTEAVDALREAVRLNPEMPGAEALLRKWEGLPE